MASQTNKVSFVAAAAAAVTPPQPPGSSQSQKVGQRGQLSSPPGSEANFSPNISEQSKRHSIDLSLSGASTPSEVDTDEDRELAEDSLSVSQMEHAESHSDAPTPLLGEISSSSPLATLHTKKSGQSLHGSAFSPSAASPASAASQEPAQAPSPANRKGPQTGNGQLRRSSEKATSQPRVEISSTSNERAITTQSVSS